MKAIFQGSTAAALQKFQEAFDGELTYAKLMRHTYLEAAVPYDSPGGQNQFSDLFMKELSMRVRKYSGIVYCSLGYSLIIPKMVASNKIFFFRRCSRISLTCSKERTSILGRDHTWLLLVNLWLACCTHGSRRSAQTFGSTWPIILETTTPRIHLQSTSRQSCHMSSTGPPLDPDPHKW